MDEKQRSDDKVEDVIEVKPEDRPEDRPEDKTEDQISKPVFSINRELIREDMVKTAVTFLMNPRVRDSPLTQKRTFLLRKGLSLEEIDSAIDRSNRLNPYFSQTPPNVPNPMQSMSTPVQPMPSFMYRSTQFASSVALFGGFIYGAYVLYKRFIEPLIFEKQRRPHPYVQIQEQLDQLSKAMVLLQNNVSTIESNIKKQIEIELKAFKAPEEVTLHELKTELASIKALLVNRRQFAATPVGAIPQWQMNDNKDSNTKVDDDSDQQMNGSVEDHNSSDDTVSDKLTNGSIESISPIPTERPTVSLQD